MSEQAKTETAENIKPEKTVKKAKKPKKLRL